MVTRLAPGIEAPKGVLTASRANLVGEGGVAGKKRMPFSSRHHWQRAAARDESYIYIYITRFPDYRIPSTTATAAGPLNRKCSGGGRKTRNVNLIASPFSATTSYQSSAPQEPPPPSSCQLFLERTEAISRWSSQRRTALRRAWMPRTLG